jgi:hypothetical protein
LKNFSKNVSGRRPRQQAVGARRRENTGTSQLPEEAIIEERRRKKEERREKRQAKLKGESLLNLCPLDIHPWRYK